jgi:hypothetical protein
MANAIEVVADAVTVTVASGAPAEDEDEGAPRGEAFGSSSG